MTLIEARGARLAIHGRDLVRPTDIAIAAGEVLVVVGPNGAGKTSLLRLLTGETAPSAGEVLYDGSPLRDWPAWRLSAKRAVMAQAQRLSFPYTAHDVARIGVEGGARPGRRASRDAICRQALARADALHLAHRDYQTLSGGEQQRVQFARVLAQLSAGRGVAGAQALFLDEPVASLDLRHQLELMDAARDVAAEGVAVVAVLHDLNLAAAYADRLVVMADGAAIADGPPGTVLDDALVARAFGVGLAVRRSDDGAPFVLPHRRGVRTAAG
ncbi:MAG: heme ABC transporter ATP-binding protein [Microvirga sp.]|nr:heme ABC transporter ATP-binding protein [Microvirga sp.]